MSGIVTKQFFHRSAVVVARDLIGYTLARKIGKRTYRAVITETEAYEGPKDRGSHASRGKTARNEVMFGKAGIMYLYFIYGNYWMLNIVTGKYGYPAAVLIRGAEEYRGPGRLTRGLHITGALNGKALGKQNGLWVESGTRVNSKDITRTPRIGIGYAGPVWSKKLYRFVLKKERR